MLTNANPRDLPVPRSHTILADPTGPYFSNNSEISRSVVSKLNPKTPRHLLTGGASRSPTCRLRFDMGDLLRVRPPEFRLERLYEPDRDRDRDLDLERDRDREGDLLLSAGLRDLDREGLRD